MKFSIAVVLCKILSAQYEINMREQSNIGKQHDVPLCDKLQWACDNGECIAPYDTCNGIKQCADGSDEWNCDNWRMKQEEVSKTSGDSPKVLITTTTFKTATIENSYVMLSTRQLYYALIIFVMLAIILVILVRRRARMKVLMRNRRGNLIQHQDSDEDDILISSMYS